MIILNDKQIRHKVTRLAYEIIEQNIENKDIHLAGINNNGYAFAEMILVELRKINPGSLSFHLHNIRLNPADPTQSDISITTNLKDLKNKVVIVIDDVANTGRTLFFACKPFLNLLLKKLEIAVLVDRKHKSYPIQVNYMGMSLATTITENIKVDISKEDEFKVELM
jgi:pyrimidine operon attenuation protein/uracil phosphoribosyltransferase